MKRQTIVAMLFSLVAIVCSALCATAQEPEYDYRRFKFYDEEDEWWAPIVDSVAVEDFVPGYSLEHGKEVYYALSALGFDRHGLGYDEEQHRVLNLEIDYTTARLLSQLAIDAEVSSGIGAHLSACGVEATQYLLTEQPRYRGHYVRGAFSGRNYLFSVSHRATYKPQSQGVRLRDGLTVSHFARARVGRDLYVEGVYTRAIDAGVDLMYVDRRNTLRVALLVPWSERGMRQSSTYESYELLGNTMYNPLWGIYRGEVRNSRVQTTLRPEVVALWRHSLTLNTNIDVVLNVGYERIGRTALSWFDAPTPMPDNYRYMPSFFTNVLDYRAASEAWTNNDLRYTQIAWDELYHTNALQPNGHSRYAVDAHRTNRPYIRAIAGITSRIGRVDVECGVELSVDSRRRFKLLDDLLGGDYILNVDYYLRDDATYSTMLDNDLRQPDRRVVEGERYDYDYRLVRSVAAIYATAKWRLESMTFGLTTRISSELSWRRGYYEKEIFAGRSSFGRSAIVKHSPAHLAALWHYDLGEHDISCAFLIRGDSPNIDDLFLQPKYNNRTIGISPLETLYATELSYGFMRQRFSLTASLYANWSKNQCRVLHYYDDLAAIFSDVVVEGIDSLTLGVELMANVDWMRYLSSTFYLSLGRYRYTSNPDVTLYADTDNSLVAHTVSNIRGCRIGTPEVTAYGDLCFRPSGGWMARLSLQYWGVRHVEPSLVRRSERIVARTSSAEEREDLMAQQRLKDAATVDITIAKSFRVGDNRNYLRVQLSVSNLLSTRAVYNGYEHNRVRRVVSDGRSHLLPFDNQLQYGYPRSVYLSVGFGF